MGEGRVQDVELFDRELRARHGTSPDAEMYQVNITEPAGQDVQTTFEW